jgi:hypothetical protein
MKIGQPDLSEMNLSETFRESQRSRLVAESTKLKGSLNSGLFFSNGTST